MAFSLATPGHDVVLIEPGSDHWKNDASAAKVTAGQWAWLTATRGQDAKDLELELVVIAGNRPSPATEAWLSRVLPRAYLTYGFARDPAAARRR